MKHIQWKQRLLITKGLSKSLFPLNIFYKINFYYFKLSVQLFMSESDGLELNLCPSNQFPLFAFSASNSPLSSKPDDDDVQNGITVFPLKSFASTKVSTGHAAIPHQIGYPIKTVSYSSQLSTVVDTSSIFLKDSSSCSLVTLELLSVQSKSSDVYSSLASISKISAPKFSAILCATSSVCPYAEKYTTNVFPSSIVSLFSPFATAVLFSFAIIESCSLNAS